MDAAPVTQRLRQGLTDGDAHIFIGVVIVDVGVTHRIHLQIDQPMAADLVKHVIEKRHAGVRLAATGAIEVELHAHIGFTSDAVDLAATHVGHRLAGPEAEIPIMPGRNPLRRPRVQLNLLASSMSKAQLMAFLAKADANPAIQQRIDAAADVSAVVAIAREEGFLFSAASLSRHQRG
jgi:predicted ribosomally synthesized peptide with nif11-like leader